MKVICAVFCLIARLRAPGKRAIRGVAKASFMMMCVVDRIDQVDARVQMTLKQMGNW
jgi:hypothetical protein